MTEYEIILIKKEGVRKAICEVMRDKLWTIRFLTEDAQKEDFEKIESCCERVKMIADEVLQLYKEIKP